MSGVNKVILVGNVGRDPETRNTQDGSEVVNFTLATSESWKDKQTGEKREKTEWHRIVIWNEHLGKIVQQYVSKGSKLYVEGQLQTRKWTGQDGVEKYTTEVVLNRFRGEITLLGDGGGGGSPGRQTDAAPEASEEEQPDLDDEIPF